MMMVMLVSSVSSSFYRQSGHIIPQTSCVYSTFCLFPAGHKDVAIEMYKKGIGELQKGIAVEITGEGEQNF